MIILRLENKRKETIMNKEKKPERKEIFLPLFLIFFIIIVLFHQSYEQPCTTTSSLIEFDKNIRKQPIFVKIICPGKSFDLDVCTRRVKELNIPLFISGISDEVSYNSNFMLGVPMVVVQLHSM